MNDFVKLCPVFFVAFFIKTGFSMSLIEEYFKMRGVKSFSVFACSHEDYFETLKITNKLGRTGGNYITDNYTFPTIISSPYHRMGIYLDYSCDYGKEILQMSSDLFILNSTYSWFVRIDNMDELKDLEDLNFGLDSDFVTVFETDQQESFAIYDLYKVNYSSSLIVKMAATWDHKNGLNWTLNKRTVHERKNFGGIEFRGSIVITDDLTLHFNFTEDGIKRFIDNTYRPEVDKLSRCSYIFYTYLGEMFNFTTTIQPTNTWGYPKKGQKADGMLGQLQGKEAEVGLTPMTLIGIASRLDITQVAVVSVSKFRTFFIFIHPKMTATYKALLIPFTTLVWILLITMIVLIGLILFLIKFFEFSKTEGFDNSVSENLVIATGLICQQGADAISHRLPERMTILIGLIFAYVVYAYYNSEIVSSLLGSPVKYIERPDQLIKSSFKINVQNHPYIMQLFERSNDKLIHQFYLHKVKTTGTKFIESVQGMLGVQRSEVAFYSEESIIYTIIGDQFTNEEICSLQEIGIHFTLVLFFPLQKPSPLREYISFGLLKMKEAGIVQRISKQWYPRKPECQHTSHSASVEIIAVLAAHMTLLAGIIISLILLILEVIYYNNRKKCKKFILEKFSYLWDNEMFYRLNGNSVTISGYLYSNPK